MFKENLEIIGNSTKDVEADGSNVREILLAKLALIASRRAENDNAGRADGHTAAANGAEVGDDAGTNSTAFPGETSG